MSSKKLTFKFFPFKMLIVFEKLSDDELIKLARAGNSECVDLIFSKYKPLAKKISRRYFLAGGDPDDIFQEAMIGLFKGFQNYKISENSDFKSFASLCISRQIQSAIKSANRLKNKLLTEAIGLNNQGAFEISGTDSDEEHFFMLPSNTPTAESALISQENVDEMLKQITQILSPLEKHVLRYYLDGMSYKEIAKLVDKTTKAVENALTRIKCKLSFIKK